jgi:23S rRNA pseudouridine2605 synthase
MYLSVCMRMPLKKEMPKGPVLAKYIADAGICSRRKAQALITTGCVVVNKEIVKALTYRVGPKDKVVVNGETIRPIKSNVYILLNKPKDYITSVSDEGGRRTVMDLLQGVNQRVYPVGRLDRNTTGLLILTNDGQFSQYLTHPRYEVEKVYHVTLNMPLTHEHAQQTIEEGVQLADGISMFDALTYLPRTLNKQLYVTLHSGKNRIVRRMFESMGYDIVKLDRVGFAGLTKQGLRLGAWRYLTPDEVTGLRKV